MKTDAGRPIHFTYLNTHLDDRSDGQRRLGASMMLARARFEAFKTGGPVIVTGDFNSPATGTDSGAYQIITGELPPVAINQTFAEKYAVPAGALPNFTMVDLKGQAPRSAVSGNYATYTGFNAPGDASVSTRIDFVFGGSNGKWWVPFRQAWSGDVWLTRRAGLRTRTMSAGRSRTMVCSRVTTVPSSRMSRCTEDVFEEHSRSTSMWHPMYLYFI